MPTPEHAHDTQPDPGYTPVFCTVAQLVDLEPALTRGAIRNDLFLRTTNGLEASGAVIYRGRRILLHRERYLAWMETASQPRH